MAELGATPLIGFAGAPFTLASYLVEGGPSRDHARTKALMHGDPELWHDLLAGWRGSPAPSCGCRSRPARRAVQLFDSWAGALPRGRLRALRAAALRARPRRGRRTCGVPRIHFGVGTGELLGRWARPGADVVGVDFRVPLDEAATRVGPGIRRCRATSTPPSSSRPGTSSSAGPCEVLADAPGLPGHVFNLGHGVLPDTDPDVLTAHRRDRARVVGLSLSPGS